MAQKEEFEFKYEIPEDNKNSVFEEIKNIQKIRSYRIGSPKEVRLEDRYFDTLSFSLLKEGFLLRVREKNDSEKLITIKEFVERKISSLNRKEIEKIFTKKNVQESLNRLSERGIIEEISTAETGRELLHQSRLVVILKVKNDRKVREIEKGEQIIGEFSLDNVTFEKENRKAEYWGIEIEASGKEHNSDVKEVATGLEEKIRERIKKTNLSKFEKGLELFSLKEER